MKLSKTWILALALFACRTPSAAPAHQHSEAQAVGQSAPAANRDTHGGRDVGQYVSALESDKRVAELQPDSVVAKLALAPDAVVADVGCGPGVFALRFAHAVPRGFVFAVDIEPRQLDRLREHLLAEKIANVVPVLCSASTPHLPPKSCDLLFIGDTYHHFDDRIDYMRRLKEALKPGGRLAILEYKPGPLPVGPPPDHKLKAGELAKELSAAGYELVTDFADHEYHDFQVWKPRS